MVFLVRTVTTKARRNKKSGVCAPLLLVLLIDRHTQLTRLLLEKLKKKKNPNLVPIIVFPLRLFFVRRMNWVVKTILNKAPAMVGNRL